MQRGRHGSSQIVHRPNVDFHQLVERALAEDQPEKLPKTNSPLRGCFSMIALSGAVIAVTKTPPDLLRSPGNVIVPLSISFVPAQAANPDLRMPVNARALTMSPYTPHCSAPRQICTTPDRQETLTRLILHRHIGIAHDVRSTRPSPNAHGQKSDRLQRKRLHAAGPDCSVTSRSELRSRCVSIHLAIVPARGHHFEVAFGFLSRARLQLLCLGQKGRQYCGESSGLGALPGLDTLAGRIITA